MKKIFLVAALAGCFVACDNNKENNPSSRSSDTANHANHPGNSQAQTGSADHMKNMHDAMNNMMQQMQNMKPTGDPDYDFAMMMKHHHQGAIDMAKAEIAGGSDEQLKQLSRKAIEEQQKENAEFDKYMQGKTPSGNADFGQKAMGMMTPMSSIKMESSSLDAMFASMMIPHHQDAVKMAEAYLKVGRNDELKRIARSITETQPKEIQELQTWLNNNKN